MQAKQAFQDTLSLKDCANAWLKHQHSLPQSKQASVRDAAAMHILTTLVSRGYKGSVDSNK